MLCILGWGEGGEGACANIVLINFKVPGKLLYWTGIFSCNMVSTNTDRIKVLLTTYIVSPSQSILPYSLNLLPSTTAGNFLRNS